MPGPLQWNARLIVGEVAEAVARLKGGEGDPRVWQPDAEADAGPHHLVDEDQVWLHPVVPGSGKRLFSDGFVRTNLKLTGSK